MPFHEPSGNRTDKKPLSLEEQAKLHPDFAKWDAVAAEAESEDPEDALAPEHRGESSADSLYLAAKLYWLRRGVGADAQAFSSFGEHLKKPQELAKKFGVDMETAKQVVEETQQEVETFFSRFEDHDQGQRAAYLQISRLENEIGEAA